MSRKVRLQLYGKNRKIFLDGMKRYLERGIPILVDGKEVKDGQLGRILEIQEDGSFYMGDYIWEQEKAPDPMQGVVCETTAAYGPDAETAMGGMRLKEIRFDKVYHEK